MLISSVAFLLGRDRVGLDEDIKALQLKQTELSATAANNAVQIQILRAQHQALTKEIEKVGARIEQVDEKVTLVLREVKR